jgi:hypothetical protein
MTTNGILLSRKLGALVDAGLSSVNISLDTLGAEQARTHARTRAMARGDAKARPEPDKFMLITRRKGFERVVAGASVGTRSGCVL